MAVSLDIDYQVLDPGIKTKLKMLNLWKLWVIVC